MEICVEFKLAESLSSMWDMRWYRGQDCQEFSTKKLGLYFVDSKKPMKGFDCTHNIKSDYI